MSPEQLAWARVLKAGDLIATVEARLTERGGILELHQLRNLSAQEMTVLLRREATSR